MARRRAIDTALRDHYDALAEAYAGDAGGLRSLHGAIEAMAQTGCYGSGGADPERRIDDRRFGHRGQAGRSREVWATLTTLDWRTRGILALRFDPTASTADARQTFGDEGGLAESTAAARDAHSDRGEHLRGMGLREFVGGPTVRQNRALVDRILAQAAEVAAQAVRAYADAWAALYPERARQRAWRGAVYGSSTSPAATCHASDASNETVLSRAA